MRLIRVMCSGRVDLEFILRAFANGQDGVFIGGCRLGECNYVTHGNYDALANTLLAKMILAQIGINPERLRIQFMNASDGILLAESVNEFAKTVRGLGALGQGEGLDMGLLKIKLEAARKLVPYIRLVERERLRQPEKSEEKYRKFYDSDEARGLFDQLVVEKLAIAQIMLLLKDSPLSTGEIAEKLDLKPSEVSNYMNVSSMHGLVSYDSGAKRYHLA